FFRTFSKVLTFFVSFFVSRQKMKKAKHGQGGCLSTSWWEIAGQARKEEQKGRGALHSKRRV
ncbi:MAG: hypothetical protein ACRCZB_06660, partial [Bacteroidales bacterium]